MPIRPTEFWGRFPPLQLTRRQANNVTALKGWTGIRIRVGDWRVSMEDGEVLDFLPVGPRGSIHE
jgi:hypothetical protein